MLLDVSDSQLVLVDYQQRLMPAIDQGEAVLANALRLARIAQALEVPCHLTEQNPAGLGPTVDPLRALVPAPVAKTRFSAAADLLPRLADATAGALPLLVDGGIRRGTDVLKIAEFLLDDACRRHEKPTKRFSPEATQAISAYRWPGNVRELRNVMARCQVMVLKRLDDAALEASMAKIHDYLGV